MSDKYQRFWIHTSHRPMCTSVRVSAFSDPLGANESVYVIDYSAYEKMNKKCELLSEALRFYADKNNWGERWKDSICEDSSGDVNDIIVEDDVELEDEGQGPVYTYGGKLARKTLSEISR